MRNILVIGGTYFVGRVFSMIVSHRDDCRLHLLNRGHYRFSCAEISEYRADRRDAAEVSAVLPQMAFDAVVDFCAYSPGDIKAVIDGVPGEIAQYIYVSTVSVYAPSPLPKNEDAALISTHTNDQLGLYAHNKLLLEGEVARACKSSTSYTILRPTFIYGPFNYAPRESFFFERMLADQPVPIPVDATAGFDFVYVGDVTKAIMGAIGNRKANNNIYNLAAPEKLNYESYFAELERVAGGPVKRTDVTVEQVYDDNIAVPFPLDQDELICGDKASEELDFSYTPFDEGMSIAFSAYRNEYQRRVGKVSS